MQVNDLIFKELIKRGYSLDGRTRVWNIADSKLWYLTPEQAQAYLDATYSSEYKTDVGPKEQTLLAKHVQDIVNVVAKGPLNVVDLGCGDGRKAIMFLQQLEKLKYKIRYCPIDISGYMVEKALSNISSISVNDILTFQWNVSDFENLENIAPLLTRGGFNKNLYLLLGNTFGNFETHEILYNVRSAMQKGDFLIIGNGLNNNNLEEDVLKFCKGAKSDKFLSYIPLQIGLDKKDVTYDARFKHSRIEFFYTVTNDKKVTFQNKSIYFNKGDQIEVGFSYHYSKPEFIKYLKMYFDYVKIFQSDDGAYALALCRA